MSLEKSLFKVILISCILCLTTAQFQLSCGGRCRDTISFIEVRRGMCRCDPTCEETDDCCVDYQTYCVSTCRERCGAIEHPLFPCQCYDGCNTSHCCEDYHEECVVREARRFLSSVSFTSASPPPTPSAPPTTTVSTTPSSRGFSVIYGREVTCPDEMPFVGCRLNPCKFSICPKYPEASCLINECGECKAVFYNKWGHHADCYDPDKFCSTGEPIFPCENLDPCQGITCPRFPKAICVPNRCGGCYYNHVDEKGVSVDCFKQLDLSNCLPGIREQRCNPLPCTNTTCALYPTARCINRRCGECRAEFVDNEGNILNCHKPTIPPKPCPRRLQCKQNLCSTTFCSARPEAICKMSTKCGNCKAEFYENGKKLTDIQCVIPNQCKETAKCRRDPCLLYTCATRKKVVCVSQFCDGCRARFFDEEKGNELTERDCGLESHHPSPTESICPNGQPPAKCSGKICESATCGEQPFEICVEDDCDECSPLFFDKNDQLIICEDDEPFRRDFCPSGEIPLNCNQDNCRTSSCPSNPSSFCVEDPCNKCRVIYLNDLGDTIDCYDSVSHTLPTPTSPAKEICASGEERLKCDALRCRATKCTSSFKTYCAMDPCNKCRVMYFDADGRRVSCDKDDTPQFSETELAERSCKGRCNTGYQAKKPCQCYTHCQAEKNCCWDFRTYCI